MGQDSEWIFASVINFLQSPLWSTPVLNFVDQNCIFFDKEEENKLEYTSIHEAYQKLVEGLISQHVISELNIGEEQFVAACQEESSNAYAKILFDQVLAGDDFITFKKMMFRRNLALETEALALIRAKEQEMRSKIKMPELANVGTSDQQIEAAIRLSKESYETESKRKNEQNYALDDDFNKAVEKSLKEQSDLDAILNKEKDDLAKAIALSIAAAKDQEHSSMKEEERQRIFEMQQSLVRKQAATDDKQQELLLELQKQRLLDEDRNNAASSALDRLFARRKMLHQREDFISSDMDDDEKHTRQQQILEERAKLLEQSNKDRDTALKQYLETN